jgi:neutral ceramidase
VQLTYEGPIGEIDLMGYAKLGQEANGIHFRLFARSFILGGGGNRIAYVNLDAGQVSHFVKSRAVQLLNDRLKSSLYTIENLMIACTHTHGGPAGSIN